MTEAEMRLVVTNVYPTSPNWAAKVKDMKADQVQAIFLRFKREGKIK